MTCSSLVRVSAAALTLMGLGPAVVVYASTSARETSTELRRDFAEAASGSEGGQPPFPASEAAPLMVEEPDQLRYVVSAPVSVRTRDVSDTLRVVGGDEVICRWEEKRPGRG